MIYNLLIAAILIVAFFMCVASYCLGLKHGKQLSNNNIPKVQINPVKAITEHIEAKENKKVEDKIEQGWRNLMRYDGTAQEVIK